MVYAIGIAFISATFITGLSISREAHEWGKNGGKKRKINLRENPLQSCWTEKILILLDKNLNLKNL